MPHRRRCYEIVAAYTTLALLDDRPMRDLSGEIRPDPNPIGGTHIVRPDERAARRAVLAGRMLP